MAKIKYCDTELQEDDSAFCSYCGENAEQNKAESENEAEALVDADVYINKTAAVCSYIGILILIPLVFAWDSKYARFHANQGLNVLILKAAVTVVLIFTDYLLAAYLPSVFSVVFHFASSALSIFSVFGIVNAVRGKAAKLPLIGKINVLMRK